MFPKALRGLKDTVSFNFKSSNSVWFTLQYAFKPFSQYTPFPVLCYPVILTAVFHTTVASLVKLFQIVQVI